MKKENVKKVLVAGVAVAGLAAFAPAAVFADDPAPQNDAKTLQTVYDVQSKYTVTIPATVSLKADESVSATITATDVLLERGNVLSVNLTGASNTNRGYDFHAKNGSSVATYTIRQGRNDIKIGDSVARFETEKREQKSTLTFSKASGATYAGTHTENLTFTIATRPSH